MISAHFLGCVLDASVAVKWFAATGEDDRDRALALRRWHVKGTLRLLVPGSFALEVMNALRFGHKFNEREIIQAVDSLESIVFEVSPIESNLLRSSVGIASTYQLTLYDAVYVALAEREKSFHFLLPTKSW